MLKSPGDFEGHNGPYTVTEKGDRAPGTTAQPLRMRGRQVLRCPRYSFHYADLADRDTEPPEPLYWAREQPRRDSSSFPNPLRAGSILGGQTHSRKDESAAPTDCPTLAYLAHLP